MWIWRKGFDFLSSHCLCAGKGRSLGVEMEMENGITGKCEEVCLVVRIGSLGAKKIEKEGNCVVVF